MGRNVYQERYRNFTDSQVERLLNNPVGGRGSYLSRLGGTERRYLAERIEKYYQDRGNPQRIYINRSDGKTFISTEKLGRTFGKPVGEEGVRYISDVSELGGKSLAEQKRERKILSKTEISRAVATARRTGNTQLVRQGNQVYTVRPDGSFEARGTTVGERVGQRIRQDAKTGRVTVGSLVDKGQIRTEFAPLGVSRQTEKELKIRLQREKEIKEQDKLRSVSFNIAQSNIDNIIKKNVKLPLAVKKGSELDYLRGGGISLNNTQRRRLSMLWKNLKADKKTVRSLSQNIASIIILPYTAYSDTKRNQVNKKLKEIATQIKNISKSNKTNAKILREIILTYLKAYPNIVKRSLFTKSGLLEIGKIASSPFIGVYKSIEQLFRDVSISFLLMKTNKFYRNYTPKTEEGRKIKNGIYNLLEKAVKSGRKNREKYKPDILNAMIMEGIILAIVGGQSASVVLAKKGFTSASAVLSKSITTGVKGYATFEVAKAIVYPSPANLADIIDVGLISKINSKSVPVRIKKYISKVPNKVQREIIANIWKIGEVVKKRFGKVKLLSRDYSKIIKNKKVLSAFDKTVKDTGAVLYGSKIEYDVKVEYIRKVYEKLYRRKFTSEEAIIRFRKENSKLGSEVLDSLLEPPKDLDFVIRKSKVSNFINTFNKKYRYLPVLLQSFIKSKKWTKDMDLGLSQIRIDKSTVLSQLTKKQIDALLKGFTKNAETTAFKLQFLENLYKIGINKRILKTIDLSDSGFEIKSLGLKLDLHSDTEVPFTKKFLKIFTIKESLPLELPVKKKFKKAILENQKLRNYLTKKKQTYLEYVANRFAKDFKKYGLTLNKKNFIRNFPKFLEKSEITDIQSFDFLQKTTSPVNKKILKTYKEALDFLVRNTPNSIAKKSDISNDVKINLLLDNLLKYAKKTAGKLADIDSAIDELKARREILVYYSSGSRKMFNKLTKLDEKGFKLKKELSLTEQNKLLDLLENYNKFLQKKYSDSILNAEIQRIKTKSKAVTKYGSTDNQFVDLVKTVDRDLQEIKNFKTGKLQVTKDGKFAIGIKEQINRRVAGAISRIFESRRAKDLKKLYNDIKLLELVYRNKLNAYKKSPLYKRPLLGVAVRTKALLLKSKVKKFEKLAKELLKQSQRVESIFTTKGVSETVGLKEIDFNDYKSKKAKKILKRIGVKKKDIKDIESNVKKQIEKKITKKELVKKTNKQIARRLIDSAKKDIIPKERLKSFVSKVGSLLITSIYRSLSKSRSISKSKSVSKSTSKSKSKSRSKSKSKSTSKSKSASKSKSKSKSRSKSKSKSTSKSISISRSVSKSKSKSKSRSKSRSKDKKVVAQPIGLPNLRKKLPTGYNFIGRFAYRRGGRVRVSRQKKTINRTLRDAIEQVSKSLARSFEVRITGYAKQQDIKKPKGLERFRLRRGKDPRVLIFVEKSKYALDTPQERLELRLARARKRKSSRRKK